jgi:hypothetical protein
MTEQIKDALVALDVLEQQVGGYQRAKDILREFITRPQPQTVGDDFHVAMTRVIAIAKAHKADESAGGNYKGANESNRHAIEYAEKLLYTALQAAHAPVSDDPDHQCEAMEVCAEAYQLVGAYADIIPNAEKWLDNLANGQMRHKDLLPVTALQSQPRVVCSGCCGKGCNDCGHTGVPFNAFTDSEECEPNVLPIEPHTFGASCEATAAEKSAVKSFMELRRVEKLVEALEIIADDESPLEVPCHRQLAREALKEFEG